MKEQFKDKLICILGNSIDEHGWYIDDMRKFISTQNEKCYLVNRAIGGNYCGLAEKMLEDEVFSMNPDLVLFHLCENDAFYPIYDAKNDGNSEIDALKEKKDKTFYESFYRIVKTIKDHGIDVVLVSAYPANERFEGGQKIESVFDNQEKVRELKDSFYKKQSFINFDNKLVIYTEKIKEMAKELNLTYIDVFNPAREEMLKTDGMFCSDGIHYSQKGHSVLAKIYLKAFGYENIPENFDIKADKATLINNLEGVERKIQFLRRYMFYPEHEKPETWIKTEADVLEYAKRRIEKNPKDDYAITALNFFDQFETLRKTILQLAMTI